MDVPLKPCDADIVRSLKALLLKLGSGKRAAWGETGIRWAFQRAQTKLEEVRTALVDNKFDEQAAQNEFTACMLMLGALWAESLLRKPGGDT